MQKHRDDNEFLPRYVRVGKIIIPKSKKGTLIVPPNDEGFFDKFKFNYKQWDIGLIALKKN